MFTQTPVVTMYWTFFVHHSGTHEIFGRAKPSPYLPTQSTFFQWFVS
ncbi:hypothetical protein BIFGAL_04219 [Bifidobacterium gallicum DSM 20093 = LMG 11596]|uniref:Uncharacterized protein n=1 Tax=Bifidobacterium gallicum DSM 20093 = LMG 11596 TaxID=561180 RepID=D1NWG9_9BIFI|nr:hypothetical protein BIFGAL_04219 [Bifidobacterium gallicum DSM 20093 = LMG 11596]